MPSANPKLEKQASTEASDPIRQAITVIEHKIRNLEKRKLKLESYKDLQKNGKELNHDQKVAVAKYDEVLQTLDITKDLCKQIVGISNESAKQQKKLARKEAVERMQQEIAKVREVLLIQDILLNIGGDAVREDFLAGSNGAPKLTQEEMKYLDDIYNELTMKRQTEVGEPSFAQQLQKSAEHYVAIIEGKQREVVGTTYVKIKEIITSIQQCGYFDQNQAQEQDVNTEVVNETPAELRVDDEPISEQPLPEEFNANDVHIPPADSIIPIANYPVPVAPVPVVSAATGVPLPVVAPQAIPSHPNTNVDQSYYANATGFVAQQQQQQPQQPPPQNQQPQSAPRINDVIGTPNFYFLQDSELDSPDVAGQQTPLQVPHIPTAVSAPIPTQTFTNQNFAGAPVPVGQQVIYQHPPQEMQHIPGFANPNPPPPIPMPPSHQQQNLQYSPQHPTTYQQQQQSPSQPQQQQQQPPSTQKQPPTNQSHSHQQQSNFESNPNSDAQQNSIEEKGDKLLEESAKCGADVGQTNESVDWCQMSENPVDEWTSSDNQQQSGQQDQHSQQQSTWGEQRSNYRGRGGRRGNSNSYNGRNRGGGGGGSGGYQQNGRGGGQGNYYRNESNYQNGYQQRNYNNDGNSNYNGSFKRGSGGSRGGPRGSGDRGDRGDRGERVGMDRGGRNGQFRGQRGGGGSRGGYAPRGKPQTQQ